MFDYLFFRLCGNLLLDPYLIIVVDQHKIFFRLVNDLAISLNLTDDFFYSKALFI
jgi:hypothetical protein